MSDLIRYDVVTYQSDSDYDSGVEPILYPDRDNGSLGFDQNHDDAVVYLAEWDYGEETENEPVYDRHEITGYVGEYDYETNDYLMTWHPGLAHVTLYRKTLLATQRQFNTFVHGYLTAMVWANCYEYNSETREIEIAEDASEHDLTNDARNELTEDCLDFIKEEYEALHRVAKSHFSNENDWSQHGHDFALTRNGHGAGFWDRGYGRDGDYLTLASRPYGERHVVVLSHGIETE